MIFAIQKFGLNFNNTNALNGTNSQNFTDMKKVENRSTGISSKFFTKPLTSDTVSFTGLMADKDKAKLKLCVYDLDDTLLEGPQNIRDKVIEFSKANDRTLVYSSARPLRKVLSLVKDGTLTMPDYIVGNNGVNIYKNVDGEMVELKDWSNRLAKKFHKHQIRDFMVDLAKENKLSPEQMVKISDKETKKNNKFYGSKLTEYEVFNSPLNIYFMMAPGTFDKTKARIEEKLKEKNIEADLLFQNFPASGMTVEALEKYFSHETAENIYNLSRPRLNADGSSDVAIITARSDKGRATEFIRKELGYKKDEVFAAGDAENDYSHTNKGYFFVLMGNATDGLKKLIRLTANIISSDKPGVLGIYDVIRD